MLVATVVVPAGSPPHRVMNSAKNPTGIATEKNRVVGSPMTASNSSRVSLSNTHHGDGRTIRGWSDTGVEEIAACGHLLGSGGRRGRPAPTGDREHRLLATDTRTSSNAVVVPYRWMLPTTSDTSVLVMAPRRAAAAAAHEAHPDLLRRPVVRRHSSGTGRRRRGTGVQEALTEHVAVYGRVRLDARPGLGGVAAGFTHRPVRRVASARGATNTCITRGGRPRRSGPVSMRAASSARPVVRAGGLERTAGDLWRLRPWEGTAMRGCPDPGTGRSRAPVEVAGQPRPG
jgi:hypothetical protein